MKTPCIVTLLLMLLTGPSIAAVDPYPFDEPKQQERFQDLLLELRCLVCQNQSLSDSDADLAQDLRKQVYEMISEGRSDAEIVDYMVARYGDFVLYRPPVKETTFLLWAGPFLLLGVGAFVLIRVIRKRSAQLKPGTPADTVSGTHLELDSGEENS